MALAAPTPTTDDRRGSSGLFAALGPAELAYARLHLRRRCLRAGTILFLEGDACAGLVLVQQGALRLFTAHAAKEQTVQVVRPGELCNAAAACSNGVNPTSAEALDDAVVLTLASPHFSYLLRRSEAFTRLLFVALAEQMRQAVVLVGDLSFHHVTGRVAKVLLQSIHPAPGVGAGIGQRPLTQQELADLVGTAREVVARSLRTLTAAGAIRTDHGRIAILDPQRLEEAAGEAWAAPALPIRTGPTPRPGMMPFPPVGTPAFTAHVPTPNAPAIGAMLRATSARHDQLPA